MPKLPKWILDIRKQLESATPKPWWYSKEKHYDDVITHVGGSGEFVFDTMGIIKNENLEFIAASPENTDKLLRALEISIAANERAFNNLVDCLGRVKAPEPYMLDDLNEALKKIFEIGEEKK